ncbi:translation initiation factor eIF-2B [Shewanella atlantica]|uniref:Translation initiation factor eIF-2B n=1 Tax=Shewanella atlantica TaxID=271099 RepID=A0A3S0IV31_9GAMM|nr:translation initiation factor eIF-2B [Shewanella atlantica]RTR32125.1 translation initiation factor eIF-2B [Shewanella atlantica]
MENNQFKQACLEKIIADHQSGSAKIAFVALQALADYSQRSVVTEPATYLKDLNSFALELQQTRPSMAMLTNIIDAWRQEVNKNENKNPQSNLMTLKQVALGKANDLMMQSSQANDRIVQHVCELIADKSVVLTHSISSTIINCFTKLATKNISAIITESRPGNEGLLVAKMLSKSGIETQYITDAQLGLFMPKADVVLLGADSILADGSVVNKAGTYLTALAAHDVGIPFYICAENFKQSRKSSETIHLEEMDTAEINLPVLPHIVPRNIYFDVTPARLISGWINEHGVQTLTILQIGLTKPTTDKDY